MPEKFSYFDRKKQRFRESNDILQEVLRHMARQAELQTNIEIDGDNNPEIPPGCSLYEHNSNGKIIWNPGRLSLLRPEKGLTTDIQSISDFLQTASKEDHARILNANMLDFLA